MNGIPKSTSEAASENSNAEAGQKGSQETVKEALIMNNFGKILITICGVQMAAIVFGSLMIWGFVQKIPDELSDQHDAIIRIEVAQSTHGTRIQNNETSQREASIERKAMTKAITMMAGDVKHLASEVSKSNAKVDLNNRYWMEYKSGALTAP